MSLDKFKAMDLVRGFSEGDVVSHVSDKMKQRRKVYKGDDIDNDCLIGLLLPARGMYYPTNTMLVWYWY